VEVSVVCSIYVEGFNIVLNVVDFVYLGDFCVIRIVVLKLQSWRWIAVDIFKS